MKKTSLLLICLLLITAESTLAEQNDPPKKYDLTSYYPSPIGFFKSIRLIPQATITPGTNCPKGTLYSNLGNNSEIYYCTAGTPSQYLPLQGVWTASGNYLFPSDTQARLSSGNSSDIVNEKVAIGTSTGIFKLTLNNDGGILTIDRQSNSYVYKTLNVAGAGTRLIYYAKKKAFRAGYVSGTQWNDANIGDFSTAMGNSNKASGSGSTVSGGQSNTASNQNATVGGGNNNQATALNTTILGGQDNTATQSGSKSGGFDNQATGSNSSISGGSGNRASGATSNILGGASNTASQQYTLAVGGQSNSASVLYATVAGGLSNSASAQSSAVLGGQANQASGRYSIIAGGRSNTASALSTSVGGGRQNQVSVDYAVIAGGDHNVITSPSTNNIYYFPIILAGESNSIDASSAFLGAAPLIVGGANNVLNADRSLVAGRNMNLATDARGTFLWGHSNNAITPISTSSAFLIYSGRVGFRDRNPQAIVEVNGNGSTDPYLAMTDSQDSTASAIGNRLIITNNGRVGVGGITNPSHPLHFQSGAHITAAGKFNNSSSRRYKTQITDLHSNVALEIFNNLTPVRFNYKNNPKEEYLGFIAEDVPSQVADQQRQGIYPLDITAVLIKVTQDQDQILKDNQAKTKQLLQEVAELEQKIKAKISIQRQ